MPDGDAHRLPGTFGPRPVVLQAFSHVVGVRWQALVNAGGRGRAAVEGTGKEKVLGVLIGHLVVPTGRVGVGGRGGAGGEKLGKGRVVN